MMGIETARSTTPKKVKEQLIKAIKIILNGNESELQKFVAEVKKQFSVWSIEDIAIPRGISDITKYTNQEKAIPIHVKGSLVYNQLIKTQKLTNLDPIINGDKIKYLYLKQPNELMSHVISVKEFHSDILNLIKNSVDYNIMFEKTFKNPVISLCDFLGWNVVKVNSLSRFF